MFEIANPTIVDENEDGIWDPGELATIYADLINSGSAPFYMYPGAVISTDSRYVEVLSNDVSNTFYGIDPSATYQGVFQLKASENTPLSTEIDFEFSWGYSSTSPCDTGFCVEQASLDYSTIIGHPSILIWDPSPQHISGDRLAEYFSQNNVTGYDYINNQTLVSVDNYKTAFIFLGVYYNNHVLLCSSVFSSPSFSQPLLSFLYCTLFLTRPSLLPVYVPTKNKEHSHLISDTSTRNIILL